MNHDNMSWRQAELQRETPTEVPTSYNLKSPTKSRMADVRSELRQILSMHIIDIGHTKTSYAGTPQYNAKSF